MPDFTGTESLIRADVYNGQPCPTEPSGEYADLSGIGLSYFACHRRWPRGERGMRRARGKVPGAPALLPSREPEPSR